MEGISQVVNGSTPGNDRTPIAIVVPGLTSDSTAAVILFYLSSLHSSLMVAFAYLKPSFFHSILNILPLGWQRMDGMLLSATTVVLEGFL